jgi:hypothetical protein
MLIFQEYEFHVHPLFTFQFFDCTVISKGSLCTLPIFKVLLYPHIEMNDFDSGIAHAVSRVPT